ncbi:MAG: 7-cyano-7-deazaguanine synthase QueC [Kiritimatiellae bacterium]|nr:7-cyano-7-deazaguanine synthase QueC [Kiritimatiellia bacterium]
MKAVVVLSGGQDSAICLALAVRKYGSGEVAALTFSYGQRHSVEVKYARRLAGRFRVAAHKVVRLGFFSDITHSALLDRGAEISRAAGRSCPNTVVEGRNVFFLSAAAVWAKSLGAADVYTGVSEADFSGYPDCRGAFIRTQQRALRLALEWPVRIVTPFLHSTKADEWRIADRLGILDLVKNETVTCYNGVPGRGCGRCPACRLRNAGLASYERQAACGAGGGGLK